MAFSATRSALHGAGVAQGFQWLDGSVLEHVELIEGRAPNDIDVVTFYRLPPNLTQRHLAAPALFLAHKEVKTTYHVDGYLEHLGMDAERLTRRTAYWHSVWSHRRNQLWKGFVQVDLAPTEEVVATATPASLANSGVGP